MRILNAALARKTLRDYLPLAMATSGLLVAFVILFMLVVNNFPLEQGRQFFRMLPWVERLISAMLGADLVDSITAQGLTTFVFTHPLVWVLIIAFMLTLTSGVLAGEIDRGTMDSLATLPISRARIYATLSLVAVLTGLPICASVWLGSLLGRSVTGTLEVRMDLLAVVACHLYAAYVFLACFAIAVSAMCSRRATSLGICFLLIFYAFVLNLVVAFWPAARPIAFTGFLNYYAPLPIVREQAWRWGDIGVLLGGGAALWTAGLIVFCRRDIPAR